MALVVLKRFASSIEASLARSFLASEGIMSFLFDDQRDTRAAMPVRLMVAQEDLDTAAALLRRADAKRQDEAR